MMRSILGDFLSFWTKPRYRLPAENVPLQKKLLTIVLLLVLVGITQTVVLEGERLVYGDSSPFSSYNPFRGIEESVGISPESDPETLGDELSLWQIGFFLLLMLSTFSLIPIIEETLFRLPLRPSRFGMLIVGLFLGIGLAILFDPLPNAIYFPLLALSFLPTLLMGVFYRQIAARVENLYRQFFPIWLWGLTILFVLWHLGNYGPTDYSPPMVLFVLLLVLPLGLVFAYIRMTYGFWYGVLTHALHNLYAFAFLIYTAFTFPM